jgi:sigma-54 dependent transcriptional regulator, acetoin dehydrogenase operon transcriptional activator AcoR
LKAQVEGGAFREDLYYRLAVLEVRVPPLRERMEDLASLAKCLVAKIATRLERDDVRIDDSFLATLHGYTWAGNVRELENVIERAMVRIGPDNILTAELLQAPEHPGSKPHPPDCKVAAVIRTGEDVRPLREVEKQAIAEALNACRGNIQRTAARLGIGRNTLYRKMQEYALAPAGPSHSRRDLPTDESPSGGTPI